MLSLYGVNQAQNCWVLYDITDVWEEEKMRLYCYNLPEPELPRTTQFWVELFSSSTETCHLAPLDVHIGSYYYLTR